MKNKIILLLFLTNYVFICEAQKKKGMNLETMFYEFKDSLLNLETFEKVAKDKSYRTIQSHSIYKHRFQKTKQELLLSQNQNRIYINNQILYLEKNNSKKVLIKENQKDDRIDNSYLLDLKDGKEFIFVSVWDRKTKVYKLNQKGEILWKTNVPHTETREFPADENDTYRIYYDSSQYFAHSDHFLILKLSETNIWINLHTQNPEDKGYIEGNVLGVVWNEGEKGLGGFIRESGDTLTYSTLPIVKHIPLSCQNNGERFKVLKMPQNSEYPNLIYVQYHPISTGAVVIAYFGKENLDKNWKVNINYPIDHSKYYNEVFLSKYENKIIVHGVEAYIEYIKILDAKTGKTLYEEPKPFKFGNDE